MFNRSKNLFLVVTCATCSKLPSAIGALVPDIWGGGVWCLSVSLFYLQIQVSGWVMLLQTNTCLSLVLLFSHSLSLSYAHSLSLSFFIYQFRSFSNFLSSLLFSKPSSKYLLSLSLFLFFPFSVFLSVWGWVMFL